MKNQNFFKLINYVYNQNDKKIKIFSNYKDLLKLKKKHKFILFKPQSNFYNLAKIFIFLFKTKIKFKKNFIIFIQVNNVVYGQNFFPKWKRYYEQTSVAKYLIVWIKNLLFNIFNFKNLKCILIEKI